MKNWRMIAAALVAAGSLASVGATHGRAEERKDWFGRPLQACEPKCHWQWWLGRKAAPETAPAPEAAPGPAPRADAAARGGRTTEARNRRTRPVARASRPAKPIQRKIAPAPPTAAEGARPAEPADLAALAMLGAAPPDRPPGERAHGGPIASSFGAMALLVVRRAAAFEASSGHLVASETRAATLGDLGPQLAARNMPLSDAVFDQAEGLEQVASGALRGLVVSRFESHRALTAALAEHPGLMALPLGRPAPDPISLSAQDSASPATDPAFADPPSSADGAANPHPEPAAEKDGPVAHAFAATDSADGALQGR